MVLVQRMRGLRARAVPEAAAPAWAAWLPPSAGPGASAA